MTVITRRSLLASAALAPLLRAASLQEVRLGVTTDEIDEDLLTALKFLREFGLEWAEMRNVWGQYNTEQPVDKIREARALMDQHKVKLSTLSTGFFKVPLPPLTAAGRAAMDNQWALLDRGMERAAILGADKVRIFAFMRAKGQTAATEAEQARIWELLTEAAARAKKRNLRLVVENVGGSFINTGADAALMLKAVKADNLGLLWDPNNAGAAGERSFPDGYGLLDPARIWQVHLRDFKKKPEGGFEWAAVGDGIFNNTEQIRALLKDGFRGHFTLETHYKHPDGKMAATRTSLTALLKVIQRV